MFGALVTILACLSNKKHSLVDDIQYLKPTMVLKRMETRLNDIRNLQCKILLQNHEMFYVNWGLTPY